MNTICKTDTFADNGGSDRELVFSAQSTARDQRILRSNELLRKFGRDGSKRSGGFFSGHEAWVSLYGTPTVTDKGGGGMEVGGGEGEGQSRWGDHARDNWRKHPHVGHLINLVLLIVDIVGRLSYSILTAHSPLRSTHGFKTRFK